MKRDERFEPKQVEDKATKALAAAYASLEAGTADRQQAKLIIRHLASLTGYYNGLSLAKWMQDTGSPTGFEQACMEHQARRWVFSQILPFLSEHPDGRSGGTDQ